MKKTVPMLLWLSLATLGIYALVNLFLGVSGLFLTAALADHSSEQSAPLLADFVHISTLSLFGGILNVVLLVGLVLGHRWAYVLTLVYGLSGTAIAFYLNGPHGAWTGFMFIPVLVPIVLCTKFFFRNQVRASTVGT